MDPWVRRRTILAVDGAMLMVWWVAAFAQSLPLFVLGMILLCVVMGFKGYLRFRRTRRAFASFGAGALRFVRERRISKKGARNLGIAGAVILVLIILDALDLSYAKGRRGRGISIPLDAILSFNFEGNISGGELVIAGIVYVLLAFGLFVMWRALWKGVADASKGWRRVTYWVCLGVFFALPLVFAILDLTTEKAPADADAATVERIRQQAESLVLILSVFLAMMAAAIATVVALPHVAPELRGPSSQPQPATVYAETVR